VEVHGDGLGDTFLGQPLAQGLRQMLGQQAQAMAGPRLQPRAGTGHEALHVVGIAQRRTLALPLGQNLLRAQSARTRRPWRAVADQLRERFPKIGTLMDAAEDEVLTHMGFPKAHRLQIHSTNLLERLNAEIKRRTDVVGIFPNEAAIVRLVGALWLEPAT